LYIVYTTKTSSTSNSVCTQKWIYGINDDDDEIREPWSRIEEDGRNWLRRPKLCIESCRAVRKSM
jgi:hypothetical protein